ncbi:triose-phosphate isomerase [Umboniibacter marinipuniceus]|uniref:Triosephosphate isomerase n=1 Tax=Umboniibacter marinipuniceus TaxID=569599 RepID=A0A3M0ABE9_9GAMM|nr:triose-phosphate isomerase [Umboniibacter marinipuniceus]RMA80098.1 triosephosphate isomerase [Umboniibacter marinipuniceus]
MRVNYVLGNWKLNNQRKDIDDWLEVFKHTAKAGVRVGVSPTLGYLDYMSGKCEGLMVGAQNVSEFDQGAFTGEVSAAMLSDLGVSFCLVGHSERRQFFQETNEKVADKVKGLLSHEIIPVICCGESQVEYETGQAKEVIGAQLSAVFSRLEVSQLSKVVVAYEPVWAIGTGLTATPEVAQEIHQFIRQFAGDFFGSVAAQSLSILYGGSVNEQSAAELFAQPDIDGGLVGGASLKPTSFMQIIEALS